MSDIKLLSDDDLVAIAGGAGADGNYTAEQLKPYIDHLKKYGLLSTLKGVQTVADVEPAFQSVMGGNQTATISDAEAAILLAYLNEQRAL